MQNWLQVYKYCRHLSEGYKNTQNNSLPVKYGMICYCSHFHRSIPSRKCTIRALAIWRNFIYVLTEIYHHTSEVNVIFCCDSPNHKSTGLKIFHFCQISSPIFPVFILGLLGHPSNEVLFYLWKNVHLSRITFRSNLVKSLRSHWSLHPFHRPF